MKKRLALMLAALLIWLCAAGCAGSTGDSAAAEPTEEPIVRPAFDPYASKNVYKLSRRLTEEQEGVDYGTMVEDVKYYSETAGDYKYCNILLPPRYDEKKPYPVLYLLHGWGSGYNVHLCEDSYLRTLYGNMYREGLTVPMIIVSAEMYTAKLDRRKKIEQKDETLLTAYNAVVRDIPNDLMPFIEENYPVSTDRTGTAIMGVSQGGTKTLATAFSNLDRFGYIGVFAPDPGAVPTPYLKGTIWNVPILPQGFPEFDRRLEPYYLYLAVGADDPENVEVTKYYGRKLQQLGYRNQTDVVDGYEHDYIFWRVCFYNFLNKIFRP